MPGSRRSLLAAVALAVLLGVGVSVVLVRRRQPDDAALLRRLDQEFQNGGLFQFFWNTRGRQNGPTLQALRHVGLVDHAHVLASAIERFESERPVLVADWTAFDSSRDVDIYVRAKERSTIDALDPNWEALPALET